MRNWLPILRILIAFSMITMISCTEEPQTRRLSEPEVKALGLEPIAANESAAPKATAKEKNQTKQSNATDRIEQKTSTEDTAAAPSTGMNETSAEGKNPISDSKPETALTEPAKKKKELARRPKRNDGAELIYRPTGKDSAQNPAFSPDGNEVVFTIFHNGYNEGPAGLYRLNIYTGEVAKIFDEPQQDAVNSPGSSWSKDGRIVFSSDRENSDDIWTVMANGKELKRATDHRGEHDYIEPSISPDGKWAVYESTILVEEQSRRGSVYKERIGGGERMNLTDGPYQGTDDRQPNWSPAGDRIVFQRREANSDEWQIYTIRDDGTGEKRITGYGEDTDPSWSSDGERIAYSSTYGGLDAPSIFVIPSGGGNPARITEQAGDADSAPSFSPDGRWIAFESMRADDEDACAAIWIIEA